MFLPCVYILASSKGGSLYIGVTSDLPGRLLQHQSGLGSKHVQKYKIKRLVWFDTFEDMPKAIQKEKSLKRWLRPWKIELIEKTNPQWLPLHPGTGEFMPFEY
jgi:putative endonuclease